MNYYETDEWIEIETMRPGGMELTKRLLALAPLPDGAKILDVACGLGDTVSMLAERGFDSIGIDISEKLIAKGKKKYPNSRFLVADAKMMPFKSNSFDAVIIQCSRCIVGDVSFEVLKEGGIAYISDLAEQGSIPKVPLGFECIAYEDVSELLTEFVMHLIWENIQIPFFSLKDTKKYKYYIMAAKKIKN